MPAKKAVSIISSDSFDIGMRQLAMEFDAMDLDVNRSLDFSEFSQLIRSREMAVHSEKALRERFDALDVNGSGTVDMPEFIKFTLRDALSRTALPIKSLLASWDTDGSQDIGIEEFRDAVRYFGFEARDAEIDRIARGTRLFVAAVINGRPRGAPVTAVGPTDRAVDFAAVDSSRVGEIAILDRG
jgi:Ca2+-binding EF-hand superfamily protein